MAIIKYLCSLLIAFHSLSLSAKEINFIEIQPGMFVHQGSHFDVDIGYQGDICNVGFIIGNEAVAVIDTGGSLGVGNSILKEIKKRTNLPIRYVINTHVHLDHIYGNAAFLKESPVYVGHIELPKAMRFRKDFYEQTNLKYLNITAKESIQVPPTMLISINAPQEIDLGDRILKLDAYSIAHTNTDLVIHDIQTNTAWVGDLVFIERTPVIDGNIHGFINALESLKKQQYKMIVPGHGTPTKNGILAINKVKTYLQTMRDEIKEAIDLELGLQESIKTLGQSESGKWELFDVQNARNINIVYPMMEWE